MKIFKGNAVSVCVCVCVTVARFRRIDTSVWKKKKKKKEEHQTVKYSFKSDAFCSFSGHNFRFARFDFVQPFVHLSRWQFINQRTELFLNWIDIRTRILLIHSSHDLDQYFFSIKFALIRFDPNESMFRDCFIFELILGDELIEVIHEIICFIHRCLTYFAYPLNYIKSSKCEKSEKKKKMIRYLSCTKKRFQDISYKQFAMIIWKMEYHDVPVETVNSTNAYLRIIAIQLRLFPCLFSRKRRMLEQ